MHARSGAIRRRAGDRDLELARQVRELGMQRRPLAHVFAPRTRIFQLVGGNAREMIGRHVTNAVAAGLNAVQLNRREQRQNVGHQLELRPVELHVLARGEVAIVLVVLARDAPEHANLIGSQQAIRNRDAQHRRMLLDVEAVTQSQRTEIVLGQLTREKPLRLVPVLGDALIHERLVDLVVLIHGAGL